MPDEVIESPAVKKLQQFVTLGGLIKTVLGFIVATALGLTAVYQHFAKTAEVEKLFVAERVARRSLSCDVASQGKIINQMAQAARETRTALKNLMLVGTVQDLPKAIGEAVKDVDAALAEIEKERSRLQERKTVSGDTPC